MLISSSKRVLTIKIQGYLSYQIVIFQCFTDQAYLTVYLKKLTSGITIKKGIPKNIIREITILVFYVLIYCNMIL